MSSPQMPTPPPISKNDPVLTLTQRFRALDSKFDAKHAQVNAQAEETARVVNGFKKCASDSRTRMSFQAFVDDLEDETDDSESGVTEVVNGLIPPTTFMSPERLAESLDRDPQGE